jgi:hypothetical protein
VPVRRRPSSFRCQRYRTGDIGYFPQGALTAGDCRSGERELIASYLSELGGTASSRDREDGWRWYRASAAYGLAIWLSALGTDGYQPHDVSRTLVARYAAAFVELDPLAALTALESTGSR